MLLSEYSCSASIVKKIYVYKCGNKELTVFDESFLERRILPGIHDQIRRAHVDTRHLQHLNRTVNLRWSDDVFAVQQAQQGFADHLARAVAVCAFAVNRGAFHFVASFVGVAVVVRVARLVFSRVCVVAVRGRRGSVSGVSIVVYTQSMLMPVCLMRMVSTMRVSILSGRISVGVRVGMSMVVFASVTITFLVHVCMCVLVRVLVCIIVALRVVMVVMVCLLLVCM